jgi:fructosamine-3-kinase
MTQKMRKVAGFYPQPGDWYGEWRTAGAKRYLKRQRRRARRRGERPERTDLVQK